MLKDKINEAINLLKKGEKLAISMNPEGYLVAFSGGKDSQVLLELVRMSGVRYKAYYSVTGIDPPENIYFIRERYPGVTFLYPEKNFFRLVEQKGLPTGKHRFCCEKLKENIGIGSVVLTGVRAEESIKRSKYEQVDVISRRKEHRERNSGYSIEDFEEKNHECIKGKDRIMIRPILKWTKKDVWDFIELRGVSVNPCYKYVDRIGCMFCPFSSKKNIHYWEERYPRYQMRLLMSIKRYIENHQTQFVSAVDVYEWWKSKKSAKEYISEKRQMVMRFREAGIE